MIRGARLWADRSTFSVQTNNSIEAILRKSAAPHWLETCGPTSAVNCLDALGWPTAIGLPGGGTVQPEDVLTLWMNDLKNAGIQDAARPDIDPADYLDNEIPQYYPVALARVFGVKANFIMPAPFALIVEAVSSGAAVMICLKKPGHFLAVVAYDDVVRALIYRDPWPARTGTDGFNLRMSEAEFGANGQPFAVVVHPPEASA